MKKLNITKERYEKSKYFNKKYGKLEYVSESGKMFKTDKGKVLMFKESDEDNNNIPCPSCQGTNIDIDSDGNATCLDCDYSWELKDYTESIGADPALVCPYCGGNNCEVSIGNDDLNFTYLDRLQGETFNVECWCNDCNKPYNVTVELNVKGCSSKQVKESSKKFVKESVDRGEWLDENLFDLIRKLDDVAIKAKTELKDHNLSIKLKKVVDNLTEMIRENATES